MDYGIVDKTCVHIERSKVSPLGVYKEDFLDDSYIKDAVLLVAPHIHRLKYLTISADKIPDAINHFTCCAPLLEKLAVILNNSPPPFLSDAF